jgi:hypothetical protein
MMNTTIFTGLIHGLASSLATSKFRHIALRGITVTDLFLMGVDLWGF